MLKTKFFYDDDQAYLQDEVNKFIQDKNVINISYTVASCGYEYRHCCCVLYKDWR